MNEAALGSDKSKLNNTINTERSNKMINRINHLLKLAKKHELQIKRQRNIKYLRNSLEKRLIRVNCHRRENFKRLVWKREVQLGQVM